MSAYQVINVSFLNQTYAVGTQKNRGNEMVLFSTK